MRWRRAVAGASQVLVIAAPGAFLLLFGGWAILQGERHVGPVAFGDLPRVVAFDVFWEPVRPFTCAAGLAALLALAAAVRGTILVLIQGEARWAVREDAAGGGSRVARLFAPSRFAAGAAVVLLAAHLVFAARMFLVAAEDFATSMGSPTLIVLRSGIVISGLTLAGAGVCRAIVGWEVAKETRAHAASGSTLPW
jgi:hypothetical protein